MKPWYIDVIDARGGLAVGTQRPADLSASALSNSGSSVFVSAPFFIPEFLASRTTGFALARGHAQIGLFADKDEVPFDSLEALTEFVRRSYVRGTGGDGGGQNGGLPPLPSPEGGESTGLDPFEGDEEFDPVKHLLQAAQSNRNVIAKLGFGTSSPGASALPPGSMPGTAVSPPGGATPTLNSMRAERLSRGALIVLRELIRRAPAQIEFQWVGTFERLACVIARMGLCPLVRKKVLWAFGGQLEKRPWLHEFTHWLDYPDWRRYWPAFRTTDAFNDLIVFPVPPVTVPDSPPDGQNLQALLAVATATFSQTVISEEYAELSLFAAARLLLAEDSSPFWGEFSSTDFAADLAARAQKWLDANIPKLVFSKEVEEIIVGASRVLA